MFEGGRRALPNRVFERDRQRRILGVVVGGAAGLASEFEHNHARINSVEAPVQ